LPRHAGGEPVGRSTYFFPLLLPGPRLDAAPAVVVDGADVLGVLVDVLVLPQSERAMAETAWPWSRPWLSSLWAASDTQPPWLSGWADVVAVAPPAPVPAPVAPLALLSPLSSPLSSPGIVTLVVVAGPPDASPTTAARRARWSGGDRQGSARYPCHLRYRRRGSSGYGLVRHIPAQRGQSSVLEGLHRADGLGQDVGHLFQAEVGDDP